MNKERIEFIDLAKGFCIIIVVMHHIQLELELQLCIDNAVFVFFMPLFFFISGLFFKLYEGGAFFAKKINKLLIPFLFFYLVTAVVLPNIMHFVFHFPMRNAEGMGLKSLYGFIYPEMFTNTPIWFLWCLFIINILFYFIFLITKGEKWQIILISSILGLIGYLLGIMHVNLYGFIDTALSAMPFFCLGYIFRKYTQILTPNKYDKWNIFFVAILITITYLFANQTTNYRTNTFHLPFFSMYLLGMSGTLAVVYLSKILKHLPFISYWGRYSIIILVTHQPLIRFYISFMKSFYIDGVLCLILALVSMMLSYCLIIPLMQKYLPYVVAQKDVIKVN